MVKFNFKPQNTVVNLPLLMVTIAAGTMMLASCGNSVKSKNETAADTVTTETVTEGETLSCDTDQVCLDSIVTRGGTTSDGFGRCSKCHCKEFEGRGQTCRNCGHAYKAHY